MIKVIFRVWPIAAALTFSTVAFADGVSVREQVGGFVAAVRSGGDATLGGLVPITADQASTLKSLKGCKANRSEASTKKRAIYFWNCGASSPANYSITEIIFESGKAVGVEVSKAVVVQRSVGVGN